MRIKIDIDVPMPSWAKRVSQVLVVAIVVSGTAIAVADLQPKFVPGGKLSAEAMNANFADLDSRLAAGRTTVTLNGSRYSVGATAYVGGTQAYMGADVQGYGGAKRKCEGAFPSRPGAHMCTTEELARTAQVGLVVPNAAWYATATRVGRDANSAVTNDCFGWTDSSPGNFGATASEVSANLSFSVGACNQLLPIACCD